MKRFYFQFTFAFFFLFSMQTSAQGTETFEAPLPLNSQSWTRAGLTFTTSSSNFDTEEFVGAGAGGSDRFLGNLGAAATNSTYSINITGGATLYTMESMELYLSSSANGSVPTNDGSLTIRGLASGSQVFTYTKTGGFPTSLIGADNGFILVDFTALPGVGDVSSINIDELEVTINGFFQYLSLDNFQFDNQVLNTDPPEVQSITVVGTPNTTATSVDFLVTFNEDAFLVDVSDFIVDTNGTFGTISGISGSGTAYVVTVNGITGEGDISIDLIAGNNIEDALGNGPVSAFTTGENHSVSRCFVENFEGFSANDLTFSSNGVTFTTNTANFDVEFFNNGGAGSSDLFLSNNSDQGTGKVYSITTPGTEIFTIEAIDFLLSSEVNGANPTNNGTLTLEGRLSGSTSFTIQKTTGFPTNFGVNNGFFVVDFATEGAADYSLTNIDELRVTIGGAFQYIALDNFEHCEEVTSNLAPIVQNINLIGNPLASSSSVNFEVIFNEDAVNVTSNDFSLTTFGSAIGTISGITGSGTTYTVNVNNISGEGSLRLDLNAGTDIADLDGNTPPDIFLDGERFIVSICNVETFEGLPEGTTSWTTNTVPWSTGNSTFSVDELINGGAGGSNRYIDNLTSQGNNYINTIAITNMQMVKMGSMEIYVSSVLNGTFPSDDGTLTVRGKLDGNTLYTVTKFTGFPTVIGSNQGYYLWDFATEGGVDYSMTDVDEIEFEIGGNFQYLSIDNFKFCIEPSVIPVITCPADITQNNDAGQCSAVVTFAATETVGIPASTIIYSHQPGDIFPLGTTEVTATATNDAGSSVCTFNITVEDNILPTALCKDITLQLDASGNASLSTQNLVSANSSADFSGTQGNKNWTYGKYSAFNPAGFTQLPNFTGFVWNNPGAGAILDFPQLDANGGHPQFEGLNWAVRRWTSNYTGEVTLSGDFYDRDGNCGDGANVRIFQNGTQVYEYLNISTNSILYNLNLNVTNGDTIDFAIDPKFDAACDDTHFVANISAASSINNGSYDNCGPLTFSLSQETFTCTDLGANTVTLTVMDSNGNSSSCNAQVTVEDNIQPEITCPSDISTNATNASGAVVNYTVPVGTDNCPVTTALTVGLASGETFPIGDTDVTYVVTDAANNTAQCTFTVTVTGIAPDIQCQGDITAFNDPTTCGASVTFAATDIEGNPTSTITYSHQPGDVFPVGTTEVTATATNIIGSTFCTFNVIIEDNEDPTVDCVSNQTKDTNLDTCTYTVVGNEFDPTGFADNCPGSTIENDYNNSTSLAGAIFDTGTTTVTWTVTDTGSQPRIAVLSASDSDPRWEDEVITKLTDTGIFKSIDDIDVEIQTPTLATLQEYDAVLVWNDEPFFDTVALGNVLAAYVDAGGGVVVNMFTQFSPTIFDLEGNFRTGGYLPLDADPANFATGGPHTMNIINGSHPIMQGVTNFNGGSSSFRAVPLILQPEASLLANWSTGDPLIAYKEPTNGKTVSLNFFAPSSDSRPDLWDAETDGALIMANSLAWAAGLGNTATCSFDVTVEDNQDPEILNCPTEFTIVLDSSGNPESFDLDDFINAGVTYSDNCGIDTVEVSANSFGCSDVSDGESDASVWINEFHYDNSGTDSGEFVEVAGTAGLDLTGYSIVLYNGSNGTSYGTINLSGSIDDEGNGFGALSFPRSGIQNGGPDGFALIDNGGAVIEFLSYEGSFTATNGPANGTTSTNVGVTETSGTAAGNSIQLKGSGSVAGDFSWTAPSTDSPGDLNSGQTIIASGLQVTLTVTDVNGNVSTCSVPVTVLDNELPEILNCPTEFTIVLDGSGNGGSIDLADFTNAGVTYSDNCDIDTVEVSANSFDCSDVSAETSGDSVWINEFHYDNGGSDVGEFLEVAGTAGLDLTSYTLVLYNGSNGTQYSPTPLSGIIDDEGDGLGAVSFAISGIQNGAPDGIALIGPGDVVLEFISYEGTFNATNGPAVGMTSTDVGVSESGSAIGESLQLSGTGNTRADFSWTGSSAESPGNLNAGQTITASGLQVTLTITDVNGNVSTCVVPVKVEDNELPEILNCPTEFTIVLDGSGNGDSIDLADFTNAGVTYSDNCDIDTVEVSANSFDCSDVSAETSGDSVWINEFHYDNGGTDVGEFVEVAGTAGLDLTSYTLVLYNGSNGTQYSPTPLSGNIDDEGDGLGAVSFAISGIQNGAPDGIALIGPGDVVLEFISYEGTFNATNGPAVGMTSTDVGVSESGSAIGESLQLSGTGNTRADFSWTGSSAESPGNLNAGQTITAGGLQVTLTITDVNGNVSTCVVPVTVVDNEIPVISGTPGNITTTNDPGVCGAEVIWTAATVSDNCPNATISSDHQSGETFPVGTTTVTYIASDANGNDAISTSFTITVQDNEDPVAICPEDITASNDEGDCGAIVNFTLGATDNCSGVSVAATPASGSFFNTGDTTVTVVATDALGNTNTCTFTVTVNDTEAPMVDCLSLQVQLDEFGNGSISESDINGNSTDNCEIASISLSQTTFDCSDIGGDLDALIISEYVDGSGNDDCIEIFNGTGNPVDLNAGNYTLNFYVDGSSTPTYSVLLLGTIADREVYVVCNPFGLGAAQADQTGGFGFDGNDAIALVSNGNAVDIIGEIGIDPGTGWSSGSISTSGTTLVRNIDVLQGNINTFVANLATEWTSYSQNTFSQLGDHEIEITELANNVILTVTDTSGNVSTCEGNVTILDVTPPEAICQNVIVELDANGNGSTTASAVDNGSNDACGIASLSLNVTDFTCNDIGVNPVILTVTDSNGLTSTCSATVTVVDNVNPIVLTQDITIQLDANGTAVVTANDINDGSSDNCEILNISVSPNSFDCSNIGENTVTLTVEDVNSNSATATATVTVEDNVNPTVSCSAITVELDSTGNYALSQSDIDAISNGSNDACGIASSSVTPNAFTCAEFGDNTVTLTVTDVNGNSSTCTTIVTVNGIIPEVTITESPLPDFCQGAVVVLTANSDDAISYDWSTGDTTDSIEVPGNGTYSVIVTSATNCTASATYTVTGFDEGALISSYTILADQEVFLHGNNLVQSGAVGATASNGLIKLHQATTVVGRGQAANINLNQGSTIGTEVYQPANPILPAFQFNTQSNNGSLDATVNTNQTQTLNGSVYDVVTIKQGATVTFTQSDVYINDLKTFDGATIEFTGCANVYINEKFMLAKDGVINSTGNNVVFYVNEDVQIEKGSNVRARIHTNGNEILAKGANTNGNGNNASGPTYMTGLFIANKVHGNKNVIWNADTVCEPCSASGSSTPPVVNNSEDSSFKLDINAWPNPSDTVFNLKLITQNLNDKAEINVYDMNNKLVYSSEFGPEETFKFGKELQGGVYIVKVIQNGNSATERLIKF